jgi:serine/threonine-protein kinase HipA
VITPLETAAAPSFGPLHWEAIGDFKAMQPDGVVKFSLAGVQLKFNAAVAGDRLTAPARIGGGRCIIKAPTDRYPDLPQAEHAAMTLARQAGVNAAETRLVSIDHIDGIPREFFEHGEYALAVTRFDRTPEGGRIHMEDAGQIIGAVGERKYTMANTETILNMIRRFSTDWRADALEGIRRIVVDALVGNGDNHLKNWSFIFPAPGEVRLSPAYDIVPTVLYAPQDDLALPFAGTRQFANITLKRFRRVSTFLGLNPDWIEAEIRAQVRRAVHQWPDQLHTLLSNHHAETLIRRLDTLALVQEAQAI